MTVSMVSTMMPACHIRVAITKCGTNSQVWVFMGTLKCSPGSNPVIAASVAYWVIPVRPVASILAVINPVHHCPKPATSRASATPQGIPKLPVHKEFRCITVPMAPVTTPTATVPRIHPTPRRPEDLLGFCAGSGSSEFDTGIGIQHNLTNPDCFRSYFYTFIVAYPLKRFFQS